MKEEEIPLEIEEETTAPEIKEKEEPVFYECDENYKTFDPGEP
jgi:hypothetical protein